MEMIAIRSSSQEASQSLDLNLRSGMGCWWHVHLQRQGCEHCGILTSSSVIHKISQLQILPGRFFCESPILSTFPDESQQNSSKGEIICFLANYRVEKQSLGSMKTTNPSSTLIFRSQKRCNFEVGCLITQFRRVGQCRRAKSLFEHF